MGYRYRAIALAVVSLGLAFCSSEETDEASRCDPGRQVACACGNGIDGFQICLPSGDGYDHCHCSDGGLDGAAGIGGAGAGGGSGTGGASAASGASGSSGSIGDGGGCPPGSATNISGSCDLVEQDCSTGLTCRVEQADGGAYQSACIDLGDGTKQLGEACASHAECAAGLICALAKCTRPCCPEREGPICGDAGSCDMQISYGTGAGAAYVKVCTFSAPCTPWTNDCPAGPESDCHIGADGTLKCSIPNYAQDAGSTVGQPCTYLNDCGDSQQCDFISGSGICRWLCKASGSGGPDAGVVAGAPGEGGCLSGETCVAYPSFGWLGVCRP